MSKTLFGRVCRRARSACEYCRIPQAGSSLAFEIDHIIAKKHEGITALDNLALSCFYCNSFKGDNIAGIDPVTGVLTPLFHPRRDKWDDHFRWRNAELVGRTAVGRVTIQVLRINLPQRVGHREILLLEGLIKTSQKRPRKNR
jgi:hypothetical protein